MAPSNPFTALKGLFRRTATGGPGRKGGRRRSTRHALGGEQLENRLLLALSTTRTRSPSDGGSVRLHSDGTLFINATDRNDNIYLHNHWPYLYVHVDNDRGLQYAGHWHVHHFQRVEVDAGRGGDLIDARNCFAPTKVKGSFGSDLMYAGASTDVFIGGAQEDLFIANDDTWPQMAGHAADTFDGGDDADGVILSHHTHVHTSRVESRFGGNLPWRPTGWHWQRSAYGKWELPLIDTSNGQHPLGALAKLNYEIKAELRADGLRLSFYADATFFSRLFGQWGGASPFDSAIYVGATADSTGNLTFRITVPANAPLPFGDAIDAAGMLGAATVDDTITYLFRWEDGPGNLYFGVEFDIDAGTRHYKGIGFKGGVDVHMGATLAIGNTRSVHSWDGFIQNFRIHAGYWAKESFTGIRVGASGTLTDQYVEIHWHNVAKFRIPFSRPAWAGSRSSTSSSMMGGSSRGLESQTLASVASESYVQPAVFVVNTKDDDLSDEYDSEIGNNKMSLRRALSLAANEDSPVEIVFHERLATGVEGAVHEIYVGNPYYEWGAGARSPLVVNNTYGHAITIDASAIGGIAITGQGMQIGAAGWEEPTAPGSGTPGYDDPYGDPYGGGGNPGTSGMSRSGAVTLRGVTFRDNVGELGGAIEVLPGAVVTLDDVWLFGNEASNAGGAVYIHGRREELTGQLGDAGSVTVIGGQWTNNTAAGGNGGVFYVGPGASLRVSGEVWAMGNTASGDGGVIYSDSAGNEAGGGLVVESGYFWNNSAGGSGGAIYAREAQLGSSDSGSADVEERIGISFMYNTAGSAGGGVALALVADASSSTSSSVLGAHIAHNTAAVGGGIYVSGPTGFDIPRQVSIEAAVNGNRATGGEGLVARGGGIFVGGGVEVPLMGSWVYANTVGGNPSADDYTGPTGEGGGVYVADGGVLTLLEGAEIGVPAPDGEGDRADVDGNSAERGGGIYFATGSTGNFTRVLVSGNTATDAGGGLFIASGSSLSFSFDRDFAALTATTISDNSAALGGGMYLAAGGPRTWALTDSGVWDWVDGLVLSGAVIADNTATNGGGIHAVGGVPAQTIALFDTTLSGNSATADGGGIWLGTGVQGSVTTSTLAANVAAGAGGGLFATSGNSLTLTAATLTDHVAGTSGGGVLLGIGGSLTATDSLFNGNTATAGAGGGIAALSGTAVTLVDTAVNTGAAGWTGGGVHATEASVSITGGQVSGNAAGSGGGLWLVGGTAALDGTTVSSNQATLGGGIGATAATSLTLDAVDILVNIATQGGGVALLDGSEAVVIGGTWAGNTARQQGGGGLVRSGSSLSADGLSVDGNGLAEVDIVPATDATAVVALLAEVGITLDADFTTPEAVEAGLETATGSRVEAVIGGSAAAAAGLAVGDVIIRFGGAEITSAEQLIETLADVAAAAQPSLVFSVVRGGEEHDVEVFTPALETQAITPASGGGFAVSDGTLSLLRSAVVGNRAGAGAGIWAEGADTVVTATSTAIAGNLASGDGGGGWLGAGATATLTTTTVAWNVAGGTGGGLAVDAAAALGLTGTIVANNTAGRDVNDSGDVIGGGSGTMLAVGGSLLAANAPFPAGRMTFLASNTSAAAADDIAGAVAAGSSHNLVATGASGGGIADGSGGNLVGTAAEPIDALLAAFGSYGGAVATVPLLPGSPALDAGTGDLADQRGIGPVGTRDIGAFESGGFRLVAVGGGMPAAQTAAAGDAFGSPLAVTVEAIAPNEPLAGGRVTFETADGEATVTVASSVTVEADLPPPEHDLPEGGSAPMPPTVDLAAIAPSEAETAVVAVVATAGEVPGSSQVIARLGDSTVVFRLTVSAETAPTVTVTGQLTAVSATYGSASSSTSFVVAGISLTGAVTISAPAGFEISTSALTNFRAQVSVTPTGGALVKQLFLRLTAGTGVGSYSGDVTITGGGAASQTVAMASSTVAAKALVVTAEAKTKVYGSADPALTYVSSGLVGGDTFSGTLTRAVGEDVGTYAISQGTLDAGSNYTVSFFGADLTITPRTLTVGGLGVADRTYDGTTAMSVSGTAVLQGVVAGDAVGLAGAVSWTLPSADAGTVALVRTGAFTLIDNAAGNYVLEQPSLTATINRRPVAVTGVTATGRTYDATTTVAVSAAAARLGAVTGVKASGVLSADATGLSLDGSAAVGTIATKGAGTKPVTVTGLSLAGARAGNYVIASTASPSVTIARAPLTVSGLVANDRPFDGTNRATFNLSSASFDGVFPGDAVSPATAAGTFAGTSVGTYAVAATVTASGVDAGNYTVSAPTGLTATITPKVITISGLRATSRVYDGTTDATVTGTARYSGLISSDSATFTAPVIDGVSVATFADKHVGTAKPVTVTGYVAPSANYTLAPLVLPANITRKALTVSGATAVSRTYDGTTAVAITGGELAGMVAGDEVTLDGAAAAGTTADKRAASNKRVTVSGFAIGGTDAGNYAFTQPTGVTVTIDRKALAVIGVTASDRVYDGRTATAAVGFPAVKETEVVEGDEVTVGRLGRLAFADADVGENKPVTATGYTLAGVDARNYLVQQPAGLTATITPKVITVSGLRATSRVYDGTTAAAVTGTARYSGLAPIDAKTFPSATLDGERTATFADRHVGTARPVTVTGYVTPSPNYTLAPLVLTANITARALAISGATAAGRTYDGTTLVAVSGGALVAGGVVNDDDVVLETAAASGVLADKKAGANRPVTVSGYALAGADIGDYVLVQPTGLRATITPRPIAVVGLVGIDRVYDATTAALVGGTAALAEASIVSGDTLALLTGSSRFVFANSAVGTAKAITASGFTLSGPEAANYAIVQPVGLTASVTPATITVTGPTLVLTRSTSGTVVIPKLTATVTGLRGTDRVTGTATVSTTAAATSPVGVYEVSVTRGTLAASANYAFEFIAGSITIAAPV